MSERLVNDSKNSNDSKISEAHLNNRTPSRKKFYLNVFPELIFFLRVSDYSNELQKWKFSESLTSPSDILALNNMGRQ